MQNSTTLPSRFESWRDFYLELKEHKVLHNPQIIYTERPDIIRTTSAQPVKFLPQRFDVAFIKDQVIEEYLVLNAPSCELSEDDCAHLIELVYEYRRSVSTTDILVDKLKAVYKRIRSQRLKKDRSMYLTDRF